MKKRSLIFSCILPLIVGLMVSCKKNTPVDYVDPYIGNVSHLLVPTYPTVHLPNSLLRVYPERADFTSEKVHGLPLVVTSHRRNSSFNLSPVIGEFSGRVKNYSYDREKIHPYLYEVTLDDQIDVRFAPSHQSAIYELKYSDSVGSGLVLNSGNGVISIDGDGLKGYQSLENNTKVYIYLETDIRPVKIAQNQYHANLYFPQGTDKVLVRYGISFIGTEQAKANLRREIVDYDLDKVARKGKDIWNDALSKIEVKGGTESDKTVFYTSLYRTYERPVCYSEDGKYFSAFDGGVHDDHGIPFYTDDWIWDTYRATHPLRILIEDQVEKDIISSYLRMAEQMGNMWMPTFPEVTGDSRRMNSNHAVATIADALAKNLDIDAEKAYEACRRALEEKTLAPWSGQPAGWIDDFYKKHGYIPALKDGEEEFDPNVHQFEKRQPIAVTLGTAYDQWCLSQIAAYLGKNEEAEHYLKCSYNYRNVFNPATSFFHPKDSDGNWIEPFDYSFSGGMGAREYYGENNGWVYRWDVPHNVADLIDLMGGKENFVDNLNQTFTQGLGRSKFAFYAKLPDHTGNVGQFSMANEPSLHVPYLYNYAGQPWMTQKRIRQMLKTWFRDDLMGIPGDEDGGGMTAFIAFSAMGFYPVTPGMPVYNIGSPLFEEIIIHLANGNDFIIKAHGASDDAKYIQSAALNGKEWNKPWITHQDIMSGAELVLEMGDRPNKAWGASDGDVPPSADLPVSMYGKIVKRFRNEYGMALGECEDGKVRILRSRQLCDVMGLTEAELYAIPNVLDKYSYVPEEIPESKLSDCHTVVMNYKAVGNGKDSLRLEIDLPDNSTEPAPFIVAIHGGGWHSGNPMGEKSNCRYFASTHKIAGVRVQYRLNDRKLTGDPMKVTHIEDQLQDIRDAVAFVKEHAEELNVNRDIYAYTGGSAGGHLAIISGINDPECDAIVPCFPVCDLKEFYAFIKKYGLNEINSELIRFFEMDNEKYKRYNPVDAVKSGVAPTLLIHGTADSTAPIKWSEEFVTNMKKAGNVCERLYFEGYEHSFVQRGNSSVYEKVIAGMENFLLKYLK